VACLYNDTHEYHESLAGYASVRFKTRSTLAWEASQDKRIMSVAKTMGIDENGEVNKTGWRNASPKIKSIIVSIDIPRALQSLQAVASITISVRFSLMVGLIGLSAGLLEVS
jgi:hypothetical protein